MAQSATMNIKEAVRTTAKRVFGVGDKFQAESKEHFLAASSLREQLKEGSAELNDAIGDIVNE